MVSSWVNSEHSPLRELSSQGILTCRILEQRMTLKSSARILHSGLRTEVQRAVPHCESRLTARKQGTGPGPLGQHPCLRPAGPPGPAGRPAVMRTLMALSPLGSGTSLPTGQCRSHLSTWTQLREGLLGRAGSKRLGLCCAARGCRCFPHASAGVLTFIALPLLRCV